MPVAERVGNSFVSQPHSQTAPAARRQRRPHSGAAAADNQYVECQHISPRFLDFLTNFVRHRPTPFAARPLAKRKTRIRGFQLFLAPD